MMAMMDRAGPVGPIRLSFALALLFGLSWPPAAAQDQTDIERGAYVFRAASCYSCHTDVKNGGAALAGGRALKTPFGVIYSPNITPDPETGIGGWSLEDFDRALRSGIAPDGSHYFPAFPYTSFTRISDADLRDLKAYLDSVEPVSLANKAHEIGPPFGWRFLLAPWKWLFFDEQRFEAQATRNDAENRGAYLAEALAHCGECHTPRNAMGGLEMEQWLAGTRDGPEGELAPNITPDGDTGIGDWSSGDIAELLKSGFKPDYDNVQGVMAEAIDHGYKYLTDEDRAAIAAYILSQPPIENLIESESESSGSAFE